MRQRIREKCHAMLGMRRHISYLLSLGGPWAGNSLTLANGVYSASSADRLAAASIKLVNKVELFNLPSVGGSLAYDKPEGLTLRDDGAVVINYDNDFGTEGANGNAFTVVTFSNPALDTEDNANGGYTAATNHDVYGLVMPDGLATFTYKNENFILAAGEGDDRNDLRSWGERRIQNDVLSHPQLRVACLFDIN
jgi:hypothetical protein